MSDESRETKEREKEKEKQEEKGKLVSMFQVGPYFILRKSK